MDPPQLQQQERQEQRENEQVQVQDSTTVHHRRPHSHQRDDGTSTSPGLTAANSQRSADPAAARQQQQPQQQQQQQPPPQQQQQQPPQQQQRDEGPSDHQATAAMGTTTPTTTTTTAMTTTTTAAKRGNESNAAKAGRLVGTLKSFGKLLKMPEPKQQTLQDCGGRDQHDAKNRAQSAAAAPVSAPAAPVSGHNSAKKKKRSFFGEVDDSRKPAASAPAPSSGPETSTPTLKRSRKDNVFTKSPENGPSRAATARQGLSRRVILPHGGAAAEARDKENMGPVWNATMREPSEQDKQPRKPEADDAGNDSDQEEASAPWSPLPPPMPSNAPDVPFIRTVDGQAMRLPVVGAAPEFTADPLFAAVHDQLEQLVGELSERAEYASGLASNAANLRHRAESLVRSKQAAVGQIKALIEQAGL